MKTGSLLKDEKETDALRKSGIEVIGDIPWGTHLCQFYETKEDLIDILVPYFVEGLMNNEFCMWVTSPPLGVEEARAALQKVVPDLERYIKKGQIEILPHTDWYLLGGEFDADRVLRGWVEKEKGALNRGFAGLRLTGNTFWIERNDWKSFVDYEATVNDVIGEHRMIAICTYSLEKCTGSDIVDVMKNHESVLFKKGETWILTEDILKRRLLEKKVRKSEEKFRNIFENASDCLVYLDSSGRILDVNRKAVEMFGGSKKELLGKHFTKVGVLSPRDIPMVMSAFAKGLAGKKTTYDTCIRNKKGQEIHVEVSGSLIKIDDKFVGLLVIARDITERKKMEEALRESEEKFRSLVQSIPECVYSALPNGEILYMSPAVKTIFGYSAEEFQKDKNLWIRLIHRDDQKELLGKVEKLLNEGVPYVHEFRMKRKDGNIVWIRVHCNAALDEKGRPTKISGVLFDITERKQMEKTLQESEEKWRSLVENAPNIILIVDRDGKIQFINRTVIDAIPEEMIGRSIYNYIDPKYHNVARKTIEQVFQTGEGGNYEVSGAGSNSSTSWYKTHVGPIKHDGQVVSVTLITTNITEIKKAEEGLKESEERLRHLIEYAPDAIYMNDLKGNFIDGNKQAENLTGYKKEELIGKNMLKVGILPKKYVPKVMKDLMQNLLGRKTGPDEYELIKKDGSRVTVEISTFPVKRGGKVEVIGIARDITERKEMEEKLRQYSEHLEDLVQKRTEELLESEKRYSVLVEEASDGVAILQDGKIVFTNQKGTEITGYSKDELIGLPFEGLVSEGYHQLTKERYERRLRGEIILSTYEIELVAKTGNQVPVELSASRIQYQGRPADLLVVRDITERKRLEEEHLRLEKLAAIGELATMVGHDLRNPLQSIENAVYCLKNECAPKLPVSIPQKAKEMFQVISDSIDYADKIIRDLQDFSAIKTPRLEKTDINAMIKEILSRVPIPNNIELCTELGALPEINVDKDEIERVFMNLTTNGIQAMENGGALTVATKKTEGFVEVSFIDTGIGLSKEKMEKLFTPFFTTKAKGMGIGLSICKKFVESHGGSIEVESEVGKGTAFTVKLPIHQNGGGEKT